MDGDDERQSLALELDPASPSEPPPDDSKDSDTPEPKDVLGDQALPPNGDEDQDAGEEAPKLTVEGLLKDPEVGPQLQSWADKSAAAQVKSATERLQTDQQQAYSSANMGQWDNYFRQFNQEELGELLAQDQQKASAYSRVQAWRQEQQQAAGSDQIATAGQVYAYAHQISVNNSLLADSGLPQEELAELAADKFTHLGAEGVTTWSKAIQTALIKHQAEAEIQKGLDTRWEAYKQEKLADLDPDGSLAGSRPGSPTPSDLPIDTPSELLLEAGLEQRARRRK